MRRFLGLVVLFLLVPSARADTPPDPLRIVPPEFGLFFKIEQPRQLFDAVSYGDLLERLKTLDAVREQLDSTNVRRLLQMLAHFEKQLGLERMDLLDQIAGGGAVLAVKPGMDPAPALIVLQGREAKLQKRFFDVAVEVLAGELARQEAKAKLETDRYHDLEVVHIGQDFHAAVSGATLIVSNKREMLKLGLDRSLDSAGKSLAQQENVQQARKLLPKPLAWAWLNLETTLHPAVGGPDTPSPFVVLGGWFDVARRSPFVCLGFSKRGDDFVASIRMPSGRDAMSAAMVAHVPPAGQPGSRPLLEPRGVLASSSFYLDLSQFWEKRSRIFADDQLKGLEQIDQNFGKLLAGGQLTQVLRQFGVYHRVVVAAQDKPGYKTVPNQKLPAAAFVTEMREPDAFARAAEAILRTVALLASSQVRLKLVEEKIGERTLIGYRFSEDADVPGDIEKVRFNFSPCFVRVGNQFVVSSTLELGREMVAVLESESQKTLGSSASPAVTQVYGAGVVTLAKAFEEQLFAQTVLAQADSPETARKQVQAIINLARQLGNARIESRYEAKEYNLDVVYSQPKR